MKSKRLGLLNRLLLGAALVAGMAFGSIGRVSASGGIIYVKASAGGLNNGTSWANAYKSLQSGIGAASSGSQIWVAAGTYKPGALRTDTFTLKKGVKIYGGFAGTETLLSQRNPVTHVTTLSGGIGAAGITDNSYSVVTGGGTDSTAVLDGFTIMAGNANGASANSIGGGMRNFGSSPTLVNLIFSGNSSATNGGGMYNGSSSNPRLTNVSFSANSAVSMGGAMYNQDVSSPILTNVTFSGNTAGYGGGLAEYISHATLTNVTFSSNKATAGAGGGMYNGGIDDSNTVTLTNVTFSGNTATGEGGGLMNQSIAATLTNVTFSANSAASGGGMGVFDNSPVLTNVTFSGNTASDRGGGIYDGGTASTKLTNVTFSGNKATITGGGMYNADTSSPQIYDGVFWNIGAQIVNVTFGASIVKDSIVAGGCPSGSTCTDVISSNPVLGPLQGNGGFTKTMALGAGSAAIDAGGVSTTCASKDQRGVTRPQGGKCDMGAYEVKALSLNSGGTNDGWVLESGENTSIGGSMNGAGTTLRVGDDASNRQYRSVLSFSTAAVPDGATVVLARVKLMKAAIVGTSPFTTHGALTLDLKKPFFGGVLGLEIGDFQASSTVTPAGGIGSTLVSGWYSGLLNSAGTAAVNKTGTTQLRLRFTTGDNNDSSADYLSLYSGDAATSDRPLLIVYYNP